MRSSLRQPYSFETETELHNNRHRVSYLFGAVNNLREYHYERHFIRVTNHHALCWLSSLKIRTGRLGRWTLALQVYNFALTFNSGSKHTGADSFGHCPVEPPDGVVDQMDGVFDIGSLRPSTIQEEQRKDN